MEELEKVIDYLMKRVIAQQERIDFLEKHIDKQNKILVDAMEASCKRQKGEKEDEKEQSEFPF